MMINITGASSQDIEVAFYDGLSCTNGNFESGSSICFYDGKGLWSPAETFTITPNKTYILRVKTTTTGTLQICGQYYTPPNNTCLNATSIGAGLLFDNNATHKPGTGVAPSGLCAAPLELENTAFYVYTVGNTGISSVSIENMDFDNNYGSNLLNLGFQFGLFTGSCSGLTSVACRSDPSSVRPPRPSCR